MKSFHKMEHKNMNENKKLKRQSYFVTEAIKMIEANGVGHLTARAVAEASGFNPASIYNYFENMDHLENLASIYFTDNYVKDLSRATRTVLTGLESYMIMWEIFLVHALNNPDLYYNVFYSAISQSGKHNLFKEYYTIFPEQRITGSYLSEMMEIDVIQNRGLYVLGLCAKEGSVDPSMVSYINDIQIGYTKCVMTDIVKSKLIKPSPAVFHKCIAYIIYSMLMYVPDDKKAYLGQILAFHLKHTEDYSTYCNAVITSER